MNPDDNASSTGATIDDIRQINAASAFNAWAGFIVVQAHEGEAAIAIASRPDLLQHAGFLHAGVIGALIDTACGFAAATQSGAVLASQYQVSCYRPAVGDRFEARAKVVRRGRRQVFAIAELFAFGKERAQLVAGGNAVLIVA